MFGFKIKRMVSSEKTGKTGNGISVTVVTQKEFCGIKLYTLDIDAIPLEEEINRMKEKYAKEQGLDEDEVYCNEEMDDDDAFCTCCCMPKDSWNAHCEYCAEDPDDTPGYR